MMLSFLCCVQCVCASFCVISVWLLFVFFKQKTAYEMRISDWSSDVCSSDLIEIEVEPVEAELVEEGFGDARPATVHADGDDGEVLSTEIGLQVVERGHLQIGRASCRERVCQYV